MISSQSCRPVWEPREASARNRQIAAVNSSTPMVSGDSHLWDELTAAICHQEK